MVESATGEDRRKYKRLYIPIFYRGASFFSRREPVIDFGLGGIRIYSDDELKIGKRLELELYLPDETSVVCTARVVWQKLLPEGAVAKYEMGLEFLEISPDGLQALAKVFDSLAPDK